MIFRTALRDIHSITILLCGPPVSVSGIVSFFIVGIEQILCFIITSVVTLAIRRIFYICANARVIQKARKPSTQCNCNCYRQSLTFGYSRQALFYACCSRTCSFQLYLFGTLYVHFTRFFGFVLSFKCMLFGCCFPTFSVQHTGHFSQCPASRPSATVPR